MKNPPPGSLHAKIAALGLTQHAVAHLLGVNARTMRRWLVENDMPEPAKRLIAVLDLPEVRTRLANPRPLP